MILPVVDDPSELKTSALLEIFVITVQRARDPRDESSGLYRDQLRLLRREIDRRFPLDLGA